MGAGQHQRLHGCLNLSADNARWFYDFSQPGDVVEVINTGGAPLELWQNGDWACRGHSGWPAALSPTIYRRLPAPPSPAT